MRSEHRFSVLCATLTAVVACANTQPLPDPNDEDDNPTVDARAQSLADARAAADARGPAPDAGPGGTDGCGSLTGDGRCNGSILYWCSSGEEREANCSDQGKHCTCDNGFCDCTSSTTGGGGGGGGGGSCGAVSFEGECAGDTLRYCEAGMLISVNCAAQGFVCDCPPYDLCDCWYY